MVTAFYQMQRSIIIPSIGVTLCLFTQYVYPCLLTFLTPDIEKWSTWFLRRSKFDEKFETFLTNFHGTCMLKNNAFSLHCRVCMMFLVYVL